MAADAPAPAPDGANRLDLGHMWRLLSSRFDETGATTEYVCELCLEHLTVRPGGVHPLEC